MTDILAGLNACCGTSYKHNWPSDMRTQGYGTERTPVCMRRYPLVEFEFCETLN